MANRKKHNLPQQSKNFSVYGLICPNDLQLKYIGYTSMLYLRYLSHNSITKNVKQKKEQWVNDLIKQELKPLLIIIAEFDTRYQAKKHECDLLSKFKNQLLNERCEYKNPNFSSRN